MQIIRASQNGGGRPGVTGKAGIFVAAAAACPRKTACGQRRKEGLIRQPIGMHDLQAIPRLKKLHIER
ncbi:hypothetical protein [Caenispirillum salinarum]|uniref:hypothetical protein n=1 Tax=Caenispirillum salinarum TaxID=859058 RepID=UPI0012671963|nr:hypothetical protein [Caenispirillum salinarum]